MNVPEPNVIGMDSRDEYWEDIVIGGGVPSWKVPAGHDPWFDERVTASVI
jgi:hypothetical protein